jgi:hypothetical protein
MVSGGSVTGRVTVWLTVRCDAGYSSAIYGATLSVHRCLVEWHRNEIVMHWNNLQAGRARLSARRVHID